MERLITHVFINEGCFWLEIGDAPGFQPKYFLPHTKQRSRPMKTIDKVQSVAN